MALILHIGAHIDHADNLCNRLRDEHRLSGCVDNSYQGPPDGFTAWGEAIGTDNNDDTTVHVTVAVETLGRAFALVDDLRAAGLIRPSNDPDMLSRFWAVVTDADDWSVDLAVRWLDQVLGGINRHRGRPTYECAGWSVL